MYIINVYLYSFVYVYVYVYVYVLLLVCVYMLTEKEREVLSNDRNACTMLCTRKKMSLMASFVFPDHQSAKQPSHRAVLWYIT